MIGGFGCLAGGEYIDTPTGPVPLKDFQGGLVNTPLGPKIAQKPEPAPSELVLVEGDDWQIHCNDAHLFGTTPKGDDFVSVASLSVRLLAKTFYKHPLLNAIRCGRQNVLLEDVQRWMQTVLDSLYSYFACCHLSDEQLHSFEEDDPDVIPLLRYALEHIPEFSREEDAGISLLCIRLFEFFYKNNQRIWALASSLGMQYPVYIFSGPLEYRLNRTCDDTCLGLLPSLMELHEALIIEYGQIQNGLLSQSYQLSPSLNTPSLSVSTEEGSTVHLLAYDTSLLDTSIITKASTKTSVKNITSLGGGIVYKFAVEEAQCYYANGLLHHNCGKSYTDVQLCLFLYHAYKNSPEPITVGILGVTIKLLKQTVIADLERAFDMGNISYRDNSQAGTITVGQITFVYLAMQNPDDIYAFNFHCAICDEIDEVPSERVQKIVTAIQERCRVRMPEGKDMPSRDPFIFFSTTAQGLGGTYQLIRYMQKKGLPYIKIRGRTQDNTNLAKSQLDLLRGLYTEEEARAYLDGEFINLSNGRVYYEFNPKVHVCMRWNPKYDETIYVGGDFNYKYNATVECVERGGHITVLNAHYWYDMGDASRGLRSLYPTQKIVFIPDASGKEIMQGFVEEFNDTDIEIFWNSRNPSITERILAVNKLFRLNKLSIMQMRDNDKNSKLDHLNMCLETRDFDDNTGKPRKGNGPNAVDHPGDALEYAVWRIIHSIRGYDDILAVLGSIGRL